MCRAIGRFGAELLGAGQGVLTHCNAGGLATADYGTALAVIFAAHEQGKAVHVFADETRPLLQGSRLTAWELQRRGVPVTLICDSMAAQVMKEGKVQAVVVGADRIAANGDTANKIGTYGVALLAKAHGIPFYVAAPSSTFDLTPRRRLVHPHRAARPPRDHPRPRPRHGPRGDRRLQPRLRRDPRRPDRRHHHRARGDPPGQRGEHPCNFNGFEFRKADAFPLILPPTTGHDRPQFTSSRWSPRGRIPTRPSTSSRDPRRVPCKP